MTPILSPPKHSARSMPHRRKLVRSCARSLLWFWSCLMRRYHPPRFESVILSLTTAKSQQPSIPAWMTWVDIIQEFSLHRNSLLTGKRTGNITFLAWNCANQMAHQRNNFRGLQKFPVPVTREFENREFSTRIREFEESELPVGPIVNRVEIRLTAYLW